MIETDEWKDIFRQSDDADNTYFVKECLFENMIPSSYDLDYLQTGLGVRNPALSFVHDAKSGKYVNVSDKAYERIMSRIKAWASLWADSQEVPKISIIARYAFVTWYESFAKREFFHKPVRREDPNNKAVETEDDIPYVEFKTLNDVVAHVISNLTEHSEESAVSTMETSALRRFIDTHPFSDFYNMIRGPLLGHDEEIRYPCYCIYSYLRSNALGEKAPRPHFIITGTSGCGKTEFLRVIRAILLEHGVDLPVFIANSASMSYEGFKGTSISEYLYHLFGGQPKPHGMGIFVLDELDKKLFPMCKDDVFSGTHELLTVLDGETIVHSPRQSPAVAIDTDNILFVGIGTFASLRNDVDMNHTIGFNIEQTKEDKYAREFDLDYLAEKSGDYEFFGRFEKVINFKSLPKESILEIVRRAIMRRFAEGDLVVSDVIFSDIAADQLFDYGNGRKGIRDAMNRCICMVSDCHAQRLLEGADCKDKDVIVILDDVDKQELTMSYVDRKTPAKSDLQQGLDDDDEADVEFKRMIDVITDVRKGIVKDFDNKCLPETVLQQNGILEAKDDSASKSSKKKSSVKKGTSKPKAKSETSAGTKKRTTSTRSKTSTKSKKS
jgi:ATP-dependent protease Clp ATPase subunit